MPAAVPTRIGPVSEKLLAATIQLAAAIKPYDVLFIEEPAVPGNIEVFKRLKEQISIPLAAGVESLNVSVAAAVLLYEARRQRA